MNDAAGELLRTISGGRVLDVATGTGAFIHTLIGGLKDWTEVIGIDSDETNRQAFSEAFEGTPGVRFVAADALDPPYPAASFDTASISNSLHHFPDPDVILSRMQDLLRDGGTLIVSEMYRDRQTPAQATHVALHHWCASVDRVSGQVHRETYRRTQLVSLLRGLRLDELRTVDVSETSEDPKADDTLNAIDGIIDRYLERATGHARLRARGQTVRRRLHEVGIHGATALLAVGRKAPVGRP